MKAKRQAGGYLLLEALISLSLISVMLVACSESFSVAHFALEQSERKNQLSICAQSKLIDLAFDTNSTDENCSTLATWQAEKVHVTPHLEQIILHGISREKNHSYEETFQISRPLR